MPRLPPSVTMAFLFLAANAIALLLATPARTLGYAAVSDPNDLSNVVWYVVMMLVFSAIILLLVKIGRERFIRWLILGLMAFSMVYVYTLPLSYLFILLQDPTMLDFNTVVAQEYDVLVALGYIAFALAILVASFFTYLLVKWPRWYIVNLVGVTTAAGLIAIIGISFGILLALVFMLVLALYDAIAVYRTKHMIVLAEAVSKQKLPVLLAVPKKVRKKEEREDMLMGLGDVIIPGILAVSAYAFLSPAGGRSLLVAIGTLAGAMAGYAVLMRYVAHGRPQAGLPLLNGGAIGGFLVSYVAVFWDLRFGLL